MQMYDDYPPVFHSLAEMEAWDEGVQDYRVCALCGANVSDAAFVNLTDITGKESQGWICWDCWGKQEVQ